MSCLATVCIVAFLIINISDVHAASGSPSYGTTPSGSASSGSISAGQIEVPKITVEGVMTHKTTDPNGIRVYFTAKAQYFGSPVSVSCTPSSGSVFSIGDTTVNCKTTKTLTMPLGKYSFVVSVKASEILLSLNPSARTITAGDTTTTTANVTISDNPNTVVSISCEVEPSGDDQGISCKVIPPELTLSSSNYTQDSQVIIETKPTTNAQKYTIKINAEYNGGNLSSETFSLDVTPAIPEISIGISGVTKPGSEITFTANLQDPSNMIKRFEWTFGDGNTETSNTNDISFIYKNEGSYPVKVIGIDSENNYVDGSEDERQITIIKPKVSIPEISIVVSGIREPGSEITFTANLQDPSNMIKRFEWTFGDNENKTSNINSIPHTYDKPSAYDISVNVLSIDTDGSTEKIAHGTTPIEIKEPESPWWIAVVVPVSIGIVGITAKLYSSKKSKSRDPKNDPQWK